MLRLLLLLCCCMPLFSYAHQIKPVKDHDTVKVDIAATSLNKILVMNDRILETYGIEGAFKIEKDEEEGSIYVMPTGFYKNTSFDLFVKTEQGHHYALHFTPVNKPATVLALKPLSAAKKTAYQWERSAPYESSLINLIKHMVAGTTPDGYAVVSLGDNKAIHKRAALTWQLKTVYHGDQLEGQIWTVKNHGNDVADVAAKMVYQHGVLAAAFAQSTLLPKQTTTLYLVVRHAS